MNKVLEAVNVCLEKYHGGQVFFDELDKMVKFDKEILDEYMRKKYIPVVDEDIELIASGEFGLCLNNYGYWIEIIVPGGLRNGTPIMDLSKFVSKGQKYLFLDGSYFSGTTASVIQEEVERCGGIFVGCYVIYDGSKEPKHKVDSMYRYWDHH